MYYKKREEYRFAMPKEYYAYLAFKDMLKEMGVKYLEEGGHTEGTISITTSGSFDVDDKCDILSVVKESKK